MGCRFKNWENSLGTKYRKTSNGKYYEDHHCHVRFWLVREVRRGFRTEQVTVSSWPPRPLAWATWKFAIAQAVWFAVQKMLPRVTMLLAHWHITLVPFYYAMIVVEIIRYGRKQKYNELFCWMDEATITILTQLLRQTRVAKGIKKMFHLLIVVHRSAKTVH